MSGTFAALMMVFCYALSYVFLHKGHVESEAEDNGLFPVLCIGALVLGAGAVCLGVVRNPGVLRSGPDAGALLATWVHTGAWHPYAYAALSGVLGTLFGRMAVYAAIRRLGATRGIVLESGEILVTLALAMAILRESLRPSDVGGVVLLAAGIGCLVLERKMLKERSLLDTGVYLGAIGAVLQGMGHFVRKLGMTPSAVPVFAAAIDVWAALLVYVLLLLWSGRLREHVRRYAHRPNPFLVAAGVVSAAGVLLFFSALQRIPVSIVAVMLGFEPLLVAIFSKLFFRDLERLTWLTWLYSGMVALGIGLVQMR
ncbi:MAG: DMT family transporter [Alicyclobacillus sp.]|nr:DMT family transporter [Alicyclobacillus sp.]